MRVAPGPSLGIALVVLTLVAGTGLGQTAQPDADRTVTTIAVQPDGDAVWTVEVWTRLEDEAAVDRFRSFQTTFRSDRAVYLDPFASRIRDVVARAGNATGREMRATNVTGTTRVQEVPRRWGIVEYRFRWEGFASRGADTLRVGDVFEGGYYLTPNDTLRLEPPAGYSVTEVAPAPAATDDEGIEWVGELDFEDTRPHVVLTATEQAGVDGSPDESPTQTTTEEDLAGGLGGWLLPLIGLVILVVGAVGYYLRSRGGQPTGQSVTTDPEAVEELLDAEGGRVKQAAIAEELGWTPSKTSRVLSQMEEAGRIERIRIGRENLVDRVED